MKYAILIPAYNAERTLPELIDELLMLPVLPVKIVVVDDGSVDNTAGVAAIDQRVLVKTLHKNQGKGSALKAGFDLILQHYNVEYILCMDADLQHPASSVPDFLAGAADGKSRFVIGNRLKKPGVMPVHRILSNSITSWLISRVTGQEIKDSQCGYRLVHRDVVTGLALHENGFQLESEMIIRAAQTGYRIDFIDIPTIYYANSSHISNLQDTMRFIRLIFREFIR